MIERRHQFFAEKMYEQIKPQLKDSMRLFGELEKELVYSRDKKRCQHPNCGAEVTWSDAEFHHVELHARGGATKINNGALVHKKCHPKSEKDVAAFAAHWGTVRTQKETSSREDITAPLKGLPTGEITQKKGTGRGRPKLTPEEIFVKEMAKIGISSQEAYELFEQVKSQKT